MTETVTVVRAARARLLDPTVEFEFRDWRYCACGQIYAAMTGEPAQHQATVYNADGEFKDVLYDVASIFEPNVDEDGDLVTWVSDLTVQVARERDMTPAMEVKREDAIKLFERALVALTSEPVTA